MKKIRRILCLILVAAMCLSFAEAVYIEEEPYDRTPEYTAAEESEQTQDALVKWIAKRFAAYGKRVELEAAPHLIYVPEADFSLVPPEAATVLQLT